MELTQLNDFGARSAPKSFKIQVFRSLCVSPNPTNLFRFCTLDLEPPMPSPIAHSVAGYICASLLPPRIVQAVSPFAQSTSARLLGLYGVLIGNLPDLDFVGEMMGLGHHRGISHSLVAMLSVSAIAGLLFFISFQMGYRLNRHRLMRIAMMSCGLTLVVYGSHLLLDYFTAGGPGMQLLQPFSDQYFQAPQPIFPSVHHSEGLLYWGHLEFIRVELAYSAIAIAGLWGWRRFRCDRSSRKQTNTTKYE